MALIIETQVSSTRTCRQCPKPLEADDPMDVCPGCLLKGARLDEDGPEEDPIAPVRSAKVRRFGDYEMIEQVGHGAWGMVYKARKISLNKICALKLLLHADTATPEELERLQIEAETAASLGHPHIVPVFDFGEFEGRHYIAMEFIEGRTLAQKIAAKEFELPRTRDLKARTRARELQRDIAQLVATMAQATGHAHNCHILHRDIKPGNILLDQKGKAYLSDFGLAKALDGVKSISKSGAVLGTVSYMSPEQAEGKRAGFPSDVFSLGAVLYELLTGRPPFKGDSVGDTLLRLKESDPDDPRVVSPLIDNDLASICLKCLEKDPNQRYATAVDLARDLDNWLANKPVKAQPVRFFGRVQRWCRREPKIAAMAAALFLLVSSVALLASVLLVRETESVIRQEREILRRRQLLIDRIERDRKRGLPVFVSAEEVALITPFEWLNGPSERQIALGARAERQRCERMVPPYGHIVQCLQTSVWAQASLAPQFNLVLYGDEADTHAGVLGGDAALFRLDPATYVIARQEVSGLIPIAQEAFGGTPRLRCAIVVHPESNITNLTDLAGRKFAFGLRDSAIGWHLPRAALAAKGLRSRSLEWTNLSSSRVTTEVRLRRIDAGVVMSEDLRQSSQAGQQFRVIQGGEFECPTLIWVATPKLDTNTVSALRRVLLSIQDKSTLAWLDYQLTGFLPVQPSDYDELERQMEHSKAFDAP